MPTALDLSIGIVEVGILFSSVLYGIATVQAFLYTERNFKDPLYLKTMVGLVWVFETMHTIFIWVLLYGLTVTNYGNSSAINDTPWSLAAALPLTSLLGSIVQVFFANRVRVLSGRLIIPIIAWCGAVLRIGFGITLGVVFINSHSIPNFFANFQWLVTTQFVLSAAVDVLNTVSLCFYLLRRRTDFKSTQRMVDKLVMYTIETGLITSMCAVAIVILSLVIPHTMVDIAIFMFYPKLFSNSFFTALNARTALRQTGTDITHVWSTGVSGFETATSGALQSRPVEVPLSPRHPAHTKSVPTRMDESYSWEDGTSKIQTIS